MDKLTLDVSVQYHEDVNMKTIFDELWHIAKYPGAEHRDRETDLVLFFEGAALAALIGIASHVIYGALTKKDVKTVSSFAMMVPAGYFLLNWLRMFLGDGRYFASLGFEAGMCMGLEVYTFTMELVYLYNGVFRKDYMLHHLLCMFFSVATAYAWLRIPDLDVAYWLFVWRSNCFMLGANFFANARLVWKNNVTNLAFAVSFVFYPIAFVLFNIVLIIIDAFSMFLAVNSVTFVASVHLCCQTWSSLRKRIVSQAKSWDFDKKVDYVVFIRSQSRQKIHIIIYIK